MEQYEQVLDLEANSSQLLIDIMREQDELLIPIVPILQFNKAYTEEENVWMQVNHPRGILDVEIT